MAFSGLRTISLRSSATPTIDQVGLAIILGYLDFRFSGEWRTRFIVLALWLTQFQQMVPGYQLTDPQAHA